MRGLRKFALGSVLLMAAPLVQAETEDGQQALVVRVRSAAGAGLAARVDLLGTTRSGEEITRAATTDASGEVRIALPPGRYGIAAEADGHGSAVGAEVDVAEGVAATTEVVLGGAPSVEDAGEGERLAGVTVHGRAASGDQALYLDERRTSGVVVEAIGAEQLARAGDSDVASSLKRATGLTLVDGRYVYVRGLGERYSSVLLNGAPIPSPDYTRRVVPLDLFPNELLDGVVVQKSYSPDMPGEFGGGTVQLRTREVPHGPFLRLQGTLAYADGTTGKDGLRDNGGARDWSGRDDGTREMPGSLLAATDGGRYLRPRSSSNPDGASPEQLQAYGRDVASAGYGLRSKELGPDTAFSIGAGNGFALADEVRLGVIGALRYSQSWNTQQEQRTTYAAGSAGLSPVAELAVDDTRRYIDLGVFARAGLDIGMNHRIGLTALQLRQTEDRARISDGTVDSVDARFFEQKWVENQLQTTQVDGHHAFPAARDLEIDWRYTHAKAQRDEPNTRRHRYDRLGDGQLEFSRRSDSNAQSWGDLSDRQRDAGVKAMLPIEFGDDTRLSLTGGADRTTRDRASAIRTFSFQLAPGSPLLVADPDLYLRPIEQIFAPGNIRPDGFVLRESTRATDNYRATQTLQAGYFNADLVWRDTYRLAVGARREQNTQQVTTFSIVSENAPPEISREDRGDWLPAAAFTWMYSENAQLRAGFSRTLSRPDFRELSRAPFTDPELDMDSVGNPELKTARLRNLDLRWEYYFSDLDSFSIGAFDKRFADPIERLRLPGSSPLLSYANARSARNYGVELELRKELGFLGRPQWMPVDPQDFHVSLNYARIRSSVELDAASAGYQTNLSRAMQGQSPYVVNLALGYTSPDEALESTLAFNRSGRRISQVGVQGQPDIYEEGLNAMDLQLRWRFAPEWRWTLRLRNLLDPPVEYTQGGLPTREYRRGRAAFVGIEWRPGLTSG